MISLSCCLATVLHDVSQTSTLPGRTGRGRHFARVDGYRTTTTEKRTTYFYHTDHLGSTVLVTDENGATVWSTEYTPFGSLTFAEGKLKRAAKFTGKDLDEDTGLYYFNARWYDQSIGRFISEDPIKDGVNWYTYAANNPLRFVDLTGFAYEDFVEEMQRRIDRLDQEALAFGAIKDCTVALPSVTNIGYRDSLAQIAGGTKIAKAQASLVTI